MLAKTLKLGPILMDYILHAVSTSVQIFFFYDEEYSTQSQVNFFSVDVNFNNLIINITAAPDWN